MKRLVLFALVSAILAGCGDDDCCTQAPHDAAVDGIPPDADTGLNGTGADIWTSVRCAI